jgi:hypothetical protein
MPHLHAQTSDRDDDEMSADEAAIFRESIEAVMNNWPLIEFLRRKVTYLKVIDDLDESVVIRSCVVKKVIGRKSNPIFRV